MLSPTPEQQAIIDAAVHGTDNLLISALAGAAKTSTLEMICKALPVQPILSLAFNKRIADEMAKRLPGHVLCKTMNAIGHQVWGQAIGRRLVVDKDKSYNLIKEVIDGLKGKAKEAAWDQYADIRRAVSTAKSAGYIPSAHQFSGRSLISLDDIKDWFEREGLDESEIPDLAIVDEVLMRSIERAYQGQIDFDDQIYMSTLFGGTFPRFPLVLVDEVQDLSGLNHAMLGKLVTQRIIAVGDPNQSIYAFRGAVSGGMSFLRDRFSMVEMGLSVSFRCPIEIVKRARSRAPHMQWPDWAKPGSVQELEIFNAASIPDFSAVICRNNAPLFKLALALIRSGRGVHLVGADIGPGLIKTLKKFGEGSMPQEKVYEAIDSWEAEKAKKAKGKAAVHDKAECLRVFASVGDTLGAAIAYAESLFKAQGPIQLLSGHKAKGLEWNNVYHLDPWRVPSQFAITDEALEQERNLEYVITTRSKENLFLVNLENFRG